MFIQMFPKPYASGPFLLLEINIFTAKMFKGLLLHIWRLHLIFFQVVFEKYHDNQFNTIKRIK